MLSSYGLGIFYLAICMFYEAGGEPLEGKVAVGHVILNRAREGRTTVEQVVTKPHQFEWYHPGMTFVVPENRALEFAECIAAVQVLASEILDGENLNGANHFFNPKVVTPSWSEDMLFVTEIGNHAFYKG